MIAAKKSTDNWIKMSVFYNRDQWHQFIAECLNPYLSEQRRRGEIGSVYISFNDFRGEHIELAFEYKAFDYERLAIAGQTLLTNYLKLNPSAATGDKYKGNQFFMDFPNNNIEPGLFNLSYHEESRQLQFLISERILSVFAEEEFEDSSVVSFALYIMMIFCKEWEKNNIISSGENELSELNLRDKIAGFLNLKDGAFAEVGLAYAFKPYTELFRANEEMIMEMYKEVNQNSEKAIDSIDLWTLKDYYNKILSENPETGRHVLLPLDEIVIVQLGMEPGSLTFIYYLIYLCLEAELAV